MSGSGRARQLRSLTAVGVPPTTTRLLTLALLSGTVLSAGCTTRQMSMPSAVAQVAPQLSVERFLQASNDRDLEAMSRLFGTADGPIGDRGSAFGCAFRRVGSWFGGSRCVSLADVEIRLHAIADILTHDNYRIVRESRVPGRANPTTQVVVDLMLGDEAAAGVPFNVVQSRDGRWLIQEVDLERAMDRRRTGPGNPRGLIR